MKTRTKQGFLSGLSASAVHSPSNRTPAADEGDQPDDEENKEQNLRDSYRRSSHSSEAQDCRDQCDYQEH
jgi:hypothetical protein